MYSVVDGHAWTYTVALINEYYTGNMKPNALSLAPTNELVQ